MTIMIYPNVYEYTNRRIHFSVTNAVKYIQQFDHKIIFPNGDSVISLLELLLKTLNMGLRANIKAYSWCKYGAVLSPECCDLRMHEILLNTIAH